MDKKSFTFEEIKQKLVNFCVYQDRCHSEVDAKLREFLVIPEARDEIILYLIKENYLNEERFARSYTRGKFYIKRWGKNKIKMHLKYKGITDKLIQKSFTEINESDYNNTLIALYHKKIVEYKGLKEYQKKSKTIHYLLSRGYAYDEITNAIQDIEEV